MYAILPYEIHEGVEIEVEIHFEMSKFVPARTQCDPDDGWDAEGGELDILSMFVISVKDERDSDNLLHLKFTSASIRESEANRCAETALRLWFEAQYKTDEKLQDRVYEACAEVANDADRKYED
jgi:hypothetical protein